VVLHGCETWHVTLREEHRLSVFENRVLRRIFGPKRDEVTGGCRKLHTEEFRNLYSSSNVIRAMIAKVQSPLPKGGGSSGHKPQEAWR
jgi:hypothetical protein